MSNVEQNDNDPLNNTGRIPAYTVEYLDAKKAAERQERRSGREWVRTLILALPYTTGLILISKLHINWVCKFGIVVLLFGVGQVFYKRAFDRAVLQRLNAELRARAD